MTGGAVDEGSLAAGCVVGGTVTAGTVVVDLGFNVVVPFVVVVPTLAVVGAGRVEGTSGPSVSRSRFDSSESEYRLTPF
jgi:hypothetical protein